MGEIQWPLKITKKDKFRVYLPVICLQRKVTSSNRLFYLMWLSQTKKTIEWKLNHEKMNLRIYHPKYIDLIAKYISEQVAFR